MSRRHAVVRVRAGGYVLVPDLAERDVFVAGPSDWVGEIRTELRAAGVADRQVSSEGFG